MKISDGYVFWWCDICGEVLVWSMLTTASPNTMCNHWGTQNQMLGPYRMRDLIERYENEQQGTAS